MKTEIVDIIARDGKACKAALAFPESKPPFPGIMIIHGGMGGHTGEKLKDSIVNENTNGRILLSKGYAVMASDYRHPSLGHLEVEDTLAAYEFFCNHPVIDNKRVALVGGSHGGVNATLAATRIKPACIITEEAGTDFAYGYQVLVNRVAENLPKLLDPPIKMDIDLWDEFRMRMGGMPHEVPEAYEKASAHSMASQIDSPFLIMSGDGIYLPHCVIMYDALVKAGKNCQFKLYRHAPHYFWFARQNIPALKEADQDAFGFLEKHLQ